MSCLLSTLILSKKVIEVAEIDSGKSSIGGVASETAIRQYMWYS